MSPTQKQEAQISQLLDSLNLSGPQLKTHIGQKSFCLFPQFLFPCVGSHAYISPKNFSVPWIPPGHSPRLLESRKVLSLLFCCNDPSLGMGVGREGRAPGASREEQKLTFQKCHHSVFFFPFNQILPSFASNIFLKFYLVFLNDKKPLNSNFKYRRTSVSICISLIALH